MVSSGGLITKRNIMTKHIMVHLCMMHRLHNACTCTAKTLPEKFIASGLLNQKKKDVDQFYFCNNKVELVGSQESIASLYTGYWTVHTNSHVPLIL